MATPKLRFKEFDNDWINTKVKDLGEFSSGGTPSKDIHDYWNGNIPWISSSDLNEESIFDIRINRFISEDAIKNSATKKIPKNSILLVSRVGVGKVALTNQELCTSQDFTALTPKKDYALFIAYLMKNITPRLLDLNQGTSIKGFVREDLISLPISLPSKAEQKKIATFLSAVDEKISQLSQKLHLLGQYKQGMMKKLFSQQIRFKADDGSQFEEWVTKTIKELNLYISDGNYGELYPTSAQFVSHGVPFIRANNIKNLKVTNNDMRFIDENLHQILNSGHLKTNDIIVTTRGDIGMVALVDSSHEGSNINAQICLLRVVDQSQLSPQFLLYFLDSSFGQKQFKELQTGTALKQLPKKSLDKIITLVPSINEQTKIANFLSAIDQKIDVVSEQLEQAKLWKKGLLQQMFV